MLSGTRAPVMEQLLTSRMAPPERRARIARWDLAYVVTALALLLVVLATIRGGTRGGDYWEHAAVVRELAAHPAQPRHPQLAVDAPHAFFSPYSLTLGLLSRATGWSADATLGIAAPVNFALICLGLWLLVRKLTPRPAAPLLALLCVIFLWGWHPPKWSSFFHLSDIGHVTAYPSAFTTGMSLIMFAALLPGRETASRGSGVGGAILTSIWLVPWSAFLLLTHAPTGTMLMCAGLAVLAVAKFPGRCDLTIPRRVALVLAIPLALALACAWPYFSLWRLLRSDQAAFAAANAELYDPSMAARVALALLGVPVIVARLRANPRDFLGLLTLGLGLGYAGGLVTNQLSLTRALPICILLLQVAVGIWIATWLGTFRGRMIPRWRPATVASVVLAFSLVAQRDALWFMLPYYRDQDELLFVQQHVKADDVILADMAASWIIPAYTGKVVAADHPLAFVADHEARRADVNRFFDPATPPVDRAAIVRKYKVRFILARPLNDDSVRVQIEGMGATVANQDGVRLVEVRQ